MILLTEVAQKLENILNGNDSETTGLTRPVDYDFVVETQGFHLDHIQNKTKGKNFIPVFISSMGGSFNPVPALKQATYTIPVIIYFPIRFKDDFFALNEYLVDVFVGTYLNYGTKSGRAISNISVAQYGEIVDLDLKEFATWVTNKYQKTIEIHQPWMTMQFTLYLSTANASFVWGNNATSSLSFTLDTTTYTDTDLTFVQGTVQSSSEPASQQLLDTSESDALPVATSYGSGFSIYVKDNDFYKNLVEKWFSGEIQTMEFTFSFTFLGKTFTRICYMQSTNLIVQKGQLTTMTFAFGKRVNLDA